MDFDTIPSILDDDTFCRNLRSARRGAAPGPVRHDLRTLATTVGVSWILGCCARLQTSSRGVMSQRCKFSDWAGHNFKKA